MRDYDINDVATAIRYQHTDAQGSVMAQTNAYDQIFAWGVYDSMGRSISPGAPASDEPGYTGQVMDSETGLTYMQQRYYDPTTGRFLSMDPVDASNADGSNLDRYWYANDNPYRYTDPDGRQDEDGNKKPPAPPCSTGALTSGGCGAADVSSKTFNVRTKSEEDSARASAQVNVVTNQSFKSTDDAAMGAYTYNEDKYQSLPKGQELLGAIIQSSSLYYFTTSTAVTANNFDIALIISSTIPGNTVAFYHTHPWGDNPDMFSTADGRQAMKNPFYMRSPSGNVSILTRAMVIQSSSGSILGASAATYSGESICPNSEPCMSPLGH